MAAPPSITALAAGPQGTAQGNVGQTLTIHGTHLTGATRAHIGPRSAALTVAPGGTSATCVLPVGHGVVNVTVSGPGGTSNPLPFYYIGAPILCGVTPGEGSAASPTAVRVSGGGLRTTNQVSFNGVPTTAAPTVTSDDHVTVVPNATAQRGASPWYQSLTVAVRTAGGSATLPNVYLAYDTPVVHALSPNHGTPQTTVVITGTGFAGGSVKVAFGGVQATHTPVSDVELHATAPPRASGAAQVVVTTPGGSSAPVTFTYH